MVSSPGAWNAYGEQTHRRRGGQGPDTHCSSFLKKGYIIYGNYCGDVEAMTLLILIFLPVWEKLKLILIRSIWNRGKGKKGGKGGGGEQGRTAEEERGGTAPTVFCKGQKGVEWK